MKPIRTFTAKTGIKILPFGLIGAIILTIYLAGSAIVLPILAFMVFLTFLSALYAYKFKVNVYEDRVEFDGTFSSDNYYFSNIVDIRSVTTVDEDGYEYISNIKVQNNNGMGEMKVSRLSENDVKELISIIQRRI